VKPVLVFDVNETMLDLAAFDGPFSEVFGDAAARREWFETMIQSALLSIATGRYTDFGALGRGALRMVAQRRGRPIGDETVEQLIGHIVKLPAHPDVIPALERLRAAGFRLATLTNSTLRVCELQLAYAGIRSFFEQALSADEVRRLKPAPEPYRMAASRLGVEVADIRLVAAHAWDVTGAIRAGCRAAFVARPGRVLDPTGETPDIVGDDLADVTARILATDL
jgi:2-haloacid dehalogenase